MKKFLFILIGCLIALCIFLFNQNQEKDQEINQWANNYKTLNISKINSESESFVYKFKVDQLNYYTDDLIKKMDSLRKELKIKDKEIESMYYLKQNISKKDTICLKDTIFIENLKLDTVLGDEWYQLHIDLEYPNIICVAPDFKSETYINTFSKKETIDKPKKFFLFRLFQKKHIITKVIVNEKNPYINTEEKVFIEITK